MKIPAQAKKKTDLFMIGILFFIFVVTLFVVFLRAPEQVASASADGVVRIDGTAHDPSVVDIVKLSGAEKSIAGMTAPVYELSVRGGKTIDQAIISYHIPDSVAGGFDKLTLIAFDPTSLSWKPVLTVVDSHKRIVTTTTAVESSLMIGLGKKTE